MATGPAEADRWRLPEIALQVSELPRLSQPLALDADLKEWAGAAVIPVRSPQCVSLPGRHPWAGPADAGVTFHCAWTDEGLCVAAVITDDDVQPGEDKEIWRQDSFKVYAGAGAPKSPRDLSIRLLRVRPPTDVTPAPLRTTTDPERVKVAGAKAVGKRTNNGYVAELLIPWSEFPKFVAQPGAQLALQFGLNDLDTRDGLDRRSQILVWGGGDVSTPHVMLPFVLADAVQRPVAQALPFGGVIRALGYLGEAPTIPLTLDVDETLPPVGGFRIGVRDTAGGIFVRQEAAALGTPAGWGFSFAPKVQWPADAPEGCYTVEVEFVGRDGQSWGALSHPMIYGGRTLPRALAALREAGLARLSQAEPFRAAAWLGVAAAVERLERSIECADPRRLVGEIPELNARVHLLRDGRLHAGDTGLYRLLALTANPEAQVVVEYGRPGFAAVTFYWGSAPLVAVAVFEHADGAKALSALAREGGTLRSLATQAPSAAGPPASTNVPTPIGPGSSRKWTRSDRSSLWPRTAGVSARFI